MTVKMTIRFVAIGAAACFGAASGAWAVPLAVVNVDAPARVKSRIKLFLGDGIYTDMGCRL
jgi:hypothetical protein